MDRLGLEMLCGLGLPPVAFVKLAADLGCRHISAGLGSMPTPLGYPPSDLRADVAMRREMIAVMEGRGVSISLGEGLIARPGYDLRDAVEDLAIFYELGARRICTSSMDADLPRSFDQFAVLAEMCADAGIELVIEFAPALTVTDLPTALAALRHIGRKDVKLLIDTMHLIRSGSSAADVAALAPDLIGYVQLADVPLKPAMPDYMQEAMFERRAPGEGELPLKEIMAALPRDVVVGLEIPELAKAQRGIGPHERVGRCVEAARRLLAQLSTD